MAARKKAQEELTKESIVETANRQFLTKDFHKVSMRAVAQELGCTHGAINHNFKNKAELFYAVVERYFDELNEKLDVSLGSEGHADDKIVQVFLGFIEFGLDHQSQYEFMFMMRDEDTDPLTQHASNKSYNKFSETLQLLSGNTLTPFTIYAAFMALHGFVTHYRGRVKTHAEADEAAAHFAQFLLKALDKS